MDANTEEWSSGLALARAHMAAGKVRAACKAYERTRQRGGWQRLRHSPLPPSPYVQHDLAINSLTELLRQSSLAGGLGTSPPARERHKRLLLARSAAHLALSRHLRTIPAEQVTEKPNGTLSAGLSCIPGCRHQTSAAPSRAVGAPCHQRPLPCLLGSPGSCRCQPGPVIVARLP